MPIHPIDIILIIFLSVLLVLLLLRLPTTFRVSFTGEPIKFFFVRGQSKVRRCFSASLIQHHALKTYCGIDVHLSKPSAYWKWVVSFRFWPLYTLRKFPLHFNNKLSGAHSRLGGGEKNIFEKGIKSVSSLQAQFRLMVKATSFSFPPKMFSSTARFFFFILNLFFLPTNSFSCNFHVGIQWTRWYSLLNDNGSRIN